MERIHQIRLVLVHPSWTRRPAFHELRQLLSTRDNPGVALECHEIGSDRLPSEKPEAEILNWGSKADLIIYCIAQGDGERLLPISPVPMLGAFDGFAAMQIERMVSASFDDYMTSPFRDQDVWPRILRYSRDYSPDEDRATIEQLQGRLGMRHLIGQSPVLVGELKRIPAIARSELTVLISGETGTGKELCARAVHLLSRRVEGPFVPVNCATLPHGLVESELFGHERGAYTGAISNRMGLVRQAEGGTVFLDEVESLDLPSQASLLRFLQEREVRAVGSERFNRADVRVIAAANVHLPAAVREGRFRSDLFYRLNEVGLFMAPLRSRGEDIGLLARHFVGKHAGDLGSRVHGISAAGIRKLRAYHWPGNVRELENVIRQALVFTDQGILSPGDLRLSNEPDDSPQLSFQSMKARVVAEFERDFVAKQLTKHNGNLTHAAKGCGKDPRAFRELARKYGF